MRKNVSAISVPALLALLLFMSGGQAWAGKKMPKAPAFTVTNIAGQTLSLKQSLEQGKPLVVYFMASWCPMCARNWPAINQAYPDYKDKVTILAVSIDPTDTATVLSNLAARKGLDFPLVPGNPQLMLDFGVKSQATTIGIDKQGNIVYMKKKKVLKESEFRALFDSLLK